MAFAHRRIGGLTSLALISGALACPAVLACPPTEGTSTPVLGRSPGAAPVFEPTRASESTRVLAAASRPADLTPDEQAQFKEIGRRRAAAERPLKVLRRQYFDNVNNPARRAEGLAQLKTYTDPALYPMLLDLFSNQGQDARGAILDMLAAQRTPEADGTLAWTAMFDHDAWQRDQAASRLVARVKDEGGKTPDVVRSAITSSFTLADPHAHTRAGQLAQTLGLVEAIPAMIAAQAGAGGAATRADSDGGSLATILIGRQITFVSDLTPVVGESAVGFDPQVSVLTEGVYMNIHDAVVTWRNVALHEQLMGWASALTGKNVAHLGWDNAAWNRWYAGELRPAMERRERLTMAMLGEPDDRLAVSRTPAAPEPVR